MSGESLKALILRTNSRLFGALAMSLFKAVNRLGLGIPGLLRLALDGVQPANPLKRERGLPEIDILIPFVLKDLETVGDCAVAAVTSSENPVAQVRLVTPYRTRERAAGDLSVVVEKVQQSLSLLGVVAQLEFDEDVVGKKILDTIKSYALLPRYNGWMTAQTVKLCGVLGGHAAATLIVDSDTLLTHPRAWIDGKNRQILMIGQESREAFFKYSNDFLGIRRRPRLSYVTHHQLMQKQVVRDIFPAGSEDIVRWLRGAAPDNGDYSEGGLKIAEYELYGAFLDTFRSRQRRYAAWGNANGTRVSGQALGSRIQKWALSTSFHHYRSRDNTPEDLF